jgi:hypothetical protein
MKGNLNGVCGINYWIDYRNYWFGRDKLIIDIENNEYAKGYLRFKMLYAECFEVYTDLRTYKCYVDEITDYQCTCIIIGGN